MVKMPTFHHVTKFMQGFHRGQKGLTLLEVVIIVGVLGILAGVLQPRISGFLRTSQVAAANTEVINVEIAAKAYYADHYGSWPPNDANTDLRPDYINADASHYNYEFDADGKVIVPHNQPSAVNPNVLWNASKNRWE